MKKMSKKTVLMFAMVLCLFALLSVGAAAWILVGEDTQEVTGDVTVDTVEDRRHNITFSDANDTEFTFVPEASTGAWLSYDGALVKDFETKVTFSVTNPESANVTVTINLASGIKNAITAGILEIEKVTIGDNTNLYVSTAPATTFEKEVELSETVGSVDVIVTFKWGTAFGGQNPVSYYNGLGVKGADVMPGEATKTYSDEAYEYLTQLAGLNDSTAYTLKVVTSTKPELLS